MQQDENKKIVMDKNTTNGRIQNWSCYLLLPYEDENESFSMKPEQI